MRWFKFCMCLQEVKWTIKREKNVFVFFIFILFDTSVAFYASMFCDSVQISRLCDSFFHLSLIRVDALSVLGTIFFSKLYLQATLYCITF